MQYSGQTQIAQALSEKSELWRIIVGFFLATAIYLGLLIVAFFCIALLTDISQTASIEAELRSMDAPRSVLLALYSFSAMIFGVTLASWVLHRQSIFNMVGQPKIIFYDFVRVVRILLILNFVVLAAGWVFSAEGFEPIPNLPFSRWLTLLPIALLGLLIQTGAEEFAFRGYLQGHLSARFKSPVLWMFLPTVLFALGHYAPSENGANAWVIVFATALFGLAAADLTARTGNIGAALGLHFMNNILALLLVSLSGPMSGLALYTYPFNASEMEFLSPLLMTDFATVLVSWLACRLACRV